MRSADILQNHNQRGGFQLTIHLDSVVAGIATELEQSRQVAQLYIVESLALGMSPLRPSLVEVCFLVSVTVL